MLFDAKILLTVVTMGYSLIPALTNFNKTHATNPHFAQNAISCCTRSTHDAFYDIDFI